MILEPVLIYLGETGAMSTGHFLEEFDVIGPVDGTTVLYAISGSDSLTYQLPVSRLLASPSLTGTPTAPTPGGSDHSTRLATTAFVQDLVSSGSTSLTTWPGSTSVVTVGTVTTGVWAGTTVAVAKGGTGATTLTGVLLGTGTTPVIIATEGSDYLSGVSPKLPLPVSFGGSNTTTPGNDLCPEQYIPYAATVVRATLTTDSPVSGAFTVRVKRSLDGGTTFPDTVLTISLASSSKRVTSTNITTPDLNSGDWLRCDITAVTGTVGSWAVRISTLSSNQEILE